MASRRRTWWWGGLLLVTAVVILMALASRWVVEPSASSDLASDPVRAARHALRLGKLDEAEALIDTALRNQPRSNAAIILAAEIAERRGDLSKACELLFEVDGSDQAAKLTCARLAIQRGHLSMAERCLLDRLHHDPQDIEANFELVKILRWQGRNWECRPRIESLLRRQQFHRDHLYVMLSIDWVWLDAREIEHLEFCRQQGWDGLLPLLGPARRTLMQEPRAEKPLEVVRALAAAEPPLLEATAWYGALLAETRRDEDFLVWQQQWSHFAESYPQTWYARGVFLQQHNDLRRAARCYWETLQRDPWHRAATLQLGQILSQLRHAHAAEPYLARARILTEIDQLIHIGAKRDGELLPTTIRQLVDQLRQLGRPLEAIGWLHVSGLPQSEIELLKHDSLEPFEQQASRSDSPPPLPQDGDWPLPAPEDFLSPAHDEHATPADNPKLAFHDDAAKTGLHFEYFNGAPATAETGRMFEFSGGGVGVVDFDRDGFPDLYCAQGADGPGPGATPRTDQLFQNRRGESWQDVTAAAGISESSFSHGAAVGDYNGDGFPDLYISNLGANRLWENLGDGTFRDVTLEADVAGDAWSLAAAFADFNQDGSVDLYVTNYLGGPDVYTRTCMHEGQPVQCLAAMFPGEPDRIYFGAGDGTFVDRSVELGLASHGGKGMGIVAGDLSGAGQIDVYVANDGMPNDFWTFADDKGSRALRNQAFLTGLATDARGRSQASMGIATADLNDDSVADFFVTNFHKEPSNLFVSESGNTYRDQGVESKLDQSPTTMGWGAQFADFDLDRDLDLVAANGHLGLRSARGAPSRMRASLWENVSSATATRFLAAHGGEYFQTPWLGRGIALLDWNRDGRMDLCVTHVDRPLALLTNVSPTTNHFIGLQLSGATDRFAVGATLRCEVDGHSETHFVNSGDGFGASNDRMILLGLGDSLRADRLVIRWPSGVVQSFSSVEAGQFYHVIEGRQRMTR